MGKYLRKDRPLTAILAAKGDETLQDSDVRRKDLLAEKVWDLATLGKVSFPDTDDPSGLRTLKASVKDWKDTAEWLYQHMDGPFKLDPASSEGVGGALADTSMKELHDVVAKFKGSSSSVAAPEPPGATHADSAG